MSAAKAAAKAGPAVAAAVPTYTLTFNGNAIVIEGVPAPESERVLAAIPGFSVNPYNNVDQLSSDQKTWNYLDALKDGTNKVQLDDLKIYDPIVLPFSILHQRENELLTRMRGSILRTTWLKTKKNSKMNIIDAENVFWEAGLGYEPFIQIPSGKPATEIVTFGSYIDPLSKPGVIWPLPNHKIQITPAFMNAFGFGMSSLEATTLLPTLITKESGGAFDYKITINCGKGCADNKNTCTFKHTPVNKNSIDVNSVYFKGNGAKNALVNDKKKPVATADKTKLIVAKGWGDKVQVMLYYMYYYIESKKTIMITCDLVVFCFCMILGIPCVYTGVYDRDVVVPHNERNVLLPGKSFFSILHFKPGTPLQNALANYDNTIDKIKSENTEFITNIQMLVDNFNTGIEVGGSYPMAFQQVFYQQLHEDMLKINGKLEGERNSMNGIVDIPRIVRETHDLKRKYLIVPMFKYTGKDKIRFLQTKLYTSDKGVTLDTILGPLKDNRSFCEYAKTIHNSNYGKNPNPVPPPPPLVGGETKEELRMYKETKQAEERKRWEGNLSRAQRVIARQAQKDDMKEVDKEYASYESNDRVKLDDDLKQLFPQRDTDPKLFRSCPGDMNEIEREYKDGEHEADLFFFDDLDDDLQDQDQDPKNRGVDFQYVFDMEIVSAIDEVVNGKLRNGASNAAANVNVNAANAENRAEYVASHENVNQQGGRNRTRRRQKGGAEIDETLFETLYTLYVYRAQYDINLDTHDRSINMKVLRELYNDYPKSEVKPNRNNTRRRVSVTGAPTLTYYVPGSQVTGMTSANRRKQAIARYAQTHKRVNTPIHINNSRSMMRTIGGRITRRKKRHYRTRK